MPSEDEDEAAVPRLSRKSPLRPVLKLCPRCLYRLQTGTKLGGWLVPQDYFCPNCGYQGLVFIEKELGAAEGPPKP